MKKEQGITLVSLVVTIIVLIILAGVSINLLLGQNGIITIAKQAKENMQLAQVEEQEELNELYSQISEEGSNSTSYDSIAKLVEFKREIASAITDMGVATPEDASAETMASNIRSFASSLNAASINYNNTNSKLTATNVQDAVDELDSEVDNINSSLTNMVKKVFRKSLTINNSTNGDFYFDVTLRGYCPIAILSIIPSDYACTISVFNLYGNGCHVGLRNVYTAPLNVNLDITVLYMKGVNIK